MMVQEAKVAMVDVRSIVWLIGVAADRTSIQSQKGL